MRSPRRASERDEGAALVLMLVFLVAASLLVIPLMNYSVAVFRHNRVLSTKTQRMEAVRGALRVALADPVRLYEACGEAGETVSRPLASANLDGVAVTSRCYFLDFASAQSDDERRFGLTVTQLGSQIPPELSGSRYAPADPADPVSWLADTAITSLTGTVWLPRLPVHPLTQRSSVPYEMPVGYPQCRVYFPGTYTEPLVLDGPTYFASGIYYFEREVRLVDGANVVAGQGEAGCATDQEAAFYVVNAPATHHITGQGATWVFGADGRLVVESGGTAPISLRFSQRYVHPDDEGGRPSEGVSIISVNGSPDTPGADLVVPGVLQVPASLVGLDDPTPAHTQSYRASRLAPVPQAPGPPRNVAATGLSGHVRVRWDEPESLGGSPITGWTVTVRDVATPTTTFTCSTPPDQRDCTVPGPVNGRAYAVEVVATNALGASAPGVAAAPVTPTPAGGTVTVPAPPQGVTATPHEAAVLVGWAPPSPGTDGGAAVTVWTATALAPDTSVAGSCTAGYGATSCLVSGLDAVPAPGVTVTVTATNLAGASPASAAVGPVSPAGAPYVSPEEPPVVASPHLPEPVVEVDLAAPPGANAAVVVEVPGYVAVPQGRLRITNPHGQEVAFRGGLLAASMEVADSRAGDPPAPESLPIGFIEMVVQRKFRIVSETASGAPRLVSTAIVQVNRNGAYAINSWEVR